jgi:hypothetical protein
MPKRSNPQNRQCYEARTGYSSKRESVAKISCLSIGRPLWRHRTVQCIGPGDIKLASCLRSNLSCSDKPRAQEDAAGKLDLAFKDLGEQALKNITRPVRAYRIATGAVSTTMQETATLALPDKPSIAVLPFANMSGDPEQECFADGMVEEIII